MFADARELPCRICPLPDPIPGFTYGVDKTFVHADIDLSA